MALPIGAVAMVAHPVSGPWVWSMLYGNDLLDLVKVPSKGALYAACNECPMVMAPHHWPVQNSVAMHKRGTGHHRIHFVVPRPHQHSDWCAPMCSPVAVA